MNKLSLGLVFYVLVVTGANVVLCLHIFQGGPASGYGRMLGLIVLLAMGALFADKWSQNTYAPAFIRVGCLLGMTVLFVILYGR